MIPDATLNINKLKVIFSSECCQHCFLSLLISLIIAIKNRLSVKYFDFTYCNYNRCNKSSLII